MNGHGSLLFKYQRRGLELRMTAVCMDVSVISITVFCYEWRWICMGKQASCFSFWYDNYNAVF